MTTPPKIPLFNPTKEDFSITYDINNDGKPPTFTLPAQEIGWFEPLVAEHILKHLSQKIMWSRGIRRNPEYDLEEIKREITVDYERPNSD